MTWLTAAIGEETSRSIIPMAAETPALPEAVLSWPLCPGIPAQPSLGLIQQHPQNLPQALSTAQDQTTVAFSRCPEPTLLPALGFIQVDEPLIPLAG